MKHTFFGGQGFVTLILGFLFSVSHLHGAPGDLDVSFGVNGTATDYIGKKAFVARVVVTQDSKIVVIGSVLYRGAIGEPPVKRLFVRRYTADGQLDRSFRGTPPEGVGFDAVQQDDGKILVFGEAPNTISTPGGPVSVVSPAVWRLTTLLTLDTSFGTSGARFLDHEILNNINLRIVQRSGQIFVSYTSRRPQPPSEYAHRVSRLALNGSVVWTKVLPFPVNITYYFWGSPFSMAVDELTGDVVAFGNEAAFVAPTLSLFRYGSNGLPIPQFGANGKAIVPECVSSDDGESRDVVVQPDGKIVTFRSTDFGGGPFVNRKEVLRFSPDGTVDPEFNCISIGLPGQSPPSRLFLQSDGRILLPLSLLGGSGRYNSDGSFYDLMVGLDLVYRAAALQDPLKMIFASVETFPENKTVVLERKHLY